jgi:hypothetical protein
MYRMLRQLFAGLAIAALLAGSVSAQTPNAAFEKTRMELRKQLDDTSAGTYPILRRAYPDEYKVFEDELVRLYLDDKKTGVDMQTHTAQFENSISNRLIAQVKYAPAPNLIALVRSQLAAMKQLQLAHYGACAEVGEKGAVQPATIPFVGSGPRPALLAFSRTSLEAGLAGKEHPTKQAPYTEADRAKVAATFKAKGGSEEYLSMLGAGRAGDVPWEMRCEQMILYFEAVLAQPDDLIARFVGD